MLTQFKMTKVIRHDGVPIRWLFIIPGMSGEMKMSFVQ